MANKIKRKNLWQQLNNIKKKEIWIKAATNLGLRVTQPQGGTSHYAIRLPGYENWDIKGLISNVYDPVRKDISEAIFKELIKREFNEDDIWKALGML